MLKAGVMVGSIMLELVLPSKLNNRFEVCLIYWRGFFALLFF